MQAKRRSGRRDAPTDQTLDRQAARLVDGAWKSKRISESLGSLKRRRFAGKNHGEGRNRTGDTTIFSRAPARHARTRAAMNGDDLQAVSSLSCVRAMLLFAAVLLSCRRLVDGALRRPTLPGP